MQIALISDIHANLPALEAVLADIDTRGDTDATYHLGDLVGYAPWPNETVAAVRAAGIPGIAGNYDSTVALDYQHCGCKYEDPVQEALSHESFAWTKAHVSEETKQFLGALPFRMDIRPHGGHAAGRTVILVHGNHVLNTVYVTEDRTDAFLGKMAEGLGARPGDIVCFGHTHRAWHRMLNGIHVVNTGSVGRPKDGDPRPGYVRLTTDGENVSVEIVRVAYEIERAATGILASTLPAEFATFLRTGGATGGATVGAG